MIICDIHLILSGYSYSRWRTTSAGWASSLYQCYENRDCYTNSERSFEAASSHSKRQGMKTVEMLLIHLMSSYWSLEHWWYGCFVHKAEQVIMLLLSTVWKFSQYLIDGWTFGGKSYLLKSLPFTEQRQNPVCCFYTRLFWGDRLLTWGKWVHALASGWFFFFQVGKGSGEKKE